MQRVHQTLGNMIHTFSVHKNDEIDENDVWSGILGAVAFGIRATVHSTTRVTPIQLVFGRDAILNVQHVANWRYIKDQKQKLIDYNNKCENAKRLPHDYKANDMILIKAEQNSKYGTDAYLGPYTIVQVNDNGTVQVNEGTITDTYNIRNITPYFSPKP